MSHSILLKKSKNFIRQVKINKFSLSKNVNLFFCSWAGCIGFLNLKFLANQKVNIIKRIILIFNELIYLNSHKLINPNEICLSDKYNNMVLTYFFPENLKKNGNYFDKYFSVETKDFKKTLWLLIPLNFTKEKFFLQKNIILLQRKRILGFSSILICFFKTLLIIFYFVFFKKILIFKNEKDNFTFDLINIVNFLLKKNKINKIIYPYESQPHQNYFNKKIKLLIPKLKIIGYMHTAIPSLPLEYLKKGCEPDLLYVNGIEQKKILKKKLGWEKNKIINISSLRYKKKIKNSMTRTIFLPYYLEDEKHAFNLFKKLIFSKPRFYFPKFKIRNHPSMLLSRPHLKLMKNLNCFLEKEKEYFKNNNFNKSLSIFFGSSAAVLEALERKVKVFHICTNVIFEKFDNFYWKKIKILKVINNVFEYKLLRSGCLIKLGTGSVRNNLF